jgi:two-component system, NarL family, response regulator DevR
MLRVLRESISGEPDLRIVGEAGTLERALTLASRVRPDVVVLDAEIPGLDALKAISALRDEVPQSAIVAISIEPDRLGSVMRGRRRVLAIGKIEGADVLLSAIRELGSTTPG